MWRMYLRLFSRDLLIGDINFLLCLPTIYQQYQCPKKGGYDLAKPSIAKEAPKEPSSDYTTDYTNDNVPEQAEASSFKD